MYFTNNPTIFHILIISIRFADYIAVYAVRRVEALILYGYTQSKDWVLLSLSRRIDHLTVCSECIICSGQQVVRLRRPVGFVSNDFTGSSCIVICTIHKNNAAVGLHSVNVPPKLTILGNNTILYIGYNR